MSTTVTKPWLKELSFLDLVETGNRVYGIPKPRSDWDYLVLGYEGLEDKLFQLEFAVGGSCNDQLDRIIGMARDCPSIGCDCEWSSFKKVYRTPWPGRIQGTVNLIVCWTEEQYENWLVARDECIMNAPLSKKECIRIHQLAGVGS